jgi:hypothetical protein
VPSIEELRARAAEQGIHPTDQDLMRVRGFLEVLLPALLELERLVPGETVPAGMFVPSEEP